METSERLHTPTTRPVIGSSDSRRTSNGAGSLNGGAHRFRCPLLFKEEQNSDLLRGSWSWQNCRLNSLRRCSRDSSRSWSPPTTPSVSLRKHYRVYFPKPILILRLL